jgi:phosphoribosylformylglycinamidine cyclo-ligase
LIGGETAEMAGFYKAGEYDIAGFCVGVADREKLLPRTDIAPSDVLIGLPSSGLHSNGFSLVRKICFEHKKMTINTRIPEIGGALGDELLKPTRLYPKTVLPLLDQGDRCAVKGMVHITGGGFYDNIPRVLPEGTGVRVDPQSWPAHPIFELLRDWGNVAEAEMFRTFNMGIGMVLIVPADVAETLIADLKSRGKAAYRIGEVVACNHEVDSREVIIEGIAK